MSDDITVNSLPSLCDDIRFPHCVPCVYGNMYGLCRVSLVVYSSLCEQKVTQHNKQYSTNKCSVICWVESSVPCAFRALLTTNNHCKCTHSIHFAIAINANARNGVQRAIIANARNSIRRAFALIAMHAISKRRALQLLQCTPF